MIAIKKLRTCVDVALRYVKKRSSTGSKRDVALVHPQERSPLNDAVDPSEEEENPVQRTMSGSIIVRRISGEIVHAQANVGNGMRVMDIVCNVCENTEIRNDEVRLVAGETILEPEMIFGQGPCIAHPGPGETLDVCLAVVPGPPVTAQSLTGSRIEVLDCVPVCGSACHFDRDYIFTSLGDFKEKGMRYVKTSNDDRKTPARKVMWQLDVREPATVFVNFRSESHLQNGDAHKWLKKDGWQLLPNFKSTVSSGYPNGPYHGPVYAKTVYPQNRKFVVDLMGSNYWEGTYFVFVQVEDER